MKKVNFKNPDFKTTVFAVMVFVFISSVLLNAGLATAAASPNSLAAHYPFDSNANDATGNGNNGIVVGATLSNNAKIQKSYKFDGNDFILIRGPNRNSDLALGSEITLSAWIKTSSARLQGIIKRGNWGAAPRYQEYALYTSQGNIYLGFGDTIKSNNINGGKVNDNQWHLVTGVLRPDNTMEIYVDGIIKATGIKTVGKHNGFRMQAIGTLKANNWFFRGFIDEARIYNYALTADQIEDLYDLSVPPPDTTPPTVSIISPANNATVSGTITISADASDNVGVARLQILVDGGFINYGQGEVLSSHISLPWNTGRYADGNHIITAIARDNAGNESQSQVAVTVLNNPPPPPPPPPSSENLILNPGFESGDATPDNWNQGNWGTNAPTFSYPAEGRTGKGAKITMSSATDGDAKWYFNDVSALPGQEYIFSDYYKSTVPTKVTARYTLTDNSFLYLDFGYPTSSPNSWTNFSYSFIVPQNVMSLTIFHLIDVAGQLSVDDFSLEKKASNNIAFNQGVVSFNFDDGWLSTFQNGVPILNSHNIKSTQYIFSEGLGAQGYITLGQMLQMQQQGHEIGAHSKTHSSLISLSQQQITDEVAGSKADLESMGINTITSFAYPYGDWNDTVKQTVAQSGYKGARTAVIQDGGFNYKNNDPFLLRTMSVEVNTPLSAVQQWINEAVNNKTWLILVFHQIENNGGQYSTTPQRLTQIADYITANNVKTVTVGQGLAEMGY